MMRNQWIKFPAGMVCAAVLLIVLSMLSTFTAAAEGNSIRFVQISDVHFNPGRDYEKGRMVKYSKDLLEDAVRQVNTMKDIDFVAFTGDMADGPNAKLLAAFAGVADKLSVPWYFAPGNHDISGTGVTKKHFPELMRGLNRYADPGNGFYAVRKNGFVFAFMDGTIDTRNTSKGYFTTDNLKFLDRLCAENTAAAVVAFQHFPVVYPMKSESHEVENAKEYLDIMDRRPNFKAVFSGHYHISRIQKRNGALHVSSPALVQYPNAFRVVTMTQTAGGLLVEINTVDTGMKEIREKSRKTSPGASLQEGKEKDRNFRIILPD